MREKDNVRLRHMLDAAEEARAFAQGRSRSDLDVDRMLVLALLKSIEILGEAAARISAESKAALPAIPWQNIIGMRNRLVHGYYDVNLDIVWRTVDEELPGLILVLRQTLAGRPPST